MVICLQDMGGLFKAELVEIAENAFPQLLFKEPAQVTAVQADSLCNGLKGDFFRIMCVQVNEDSLDFALISAEGGSAYFADHM